MTPTRPPGQFWAAIFNTTMVTYPTNLTLALANLDPAFVGTPQQYAEHVVSRLEIVALTQNYGISIVSALPVANEGPVLLGGTRLYVWSENTSQYIPLDIVDSLGVNSTGKYVLTTDTGVLAWKTVADLWSWSGIGIANLSPGAAGTIAYSNGTVNAWGTPDVALPVKSVPFSKLRAEAADVGKYLQAQADGTVVWSTLGSARGQIITTAEFDIPTTGGAVVSIQRPAGAIRIECLLVAKTAPLFVGGSNYGWSVGEEVHLEDFVIDMGSASRSSAFCVITQPEYWVVRREWSTNGGTVPPLLGNREVPSSVHLPIDVTKWKIVIRYL